jgi:rubrerythrin
VSTVSTLDKPAVERLRAAWHGEIEAESIYVRLAARETDPDMAQLLEHMAAAESTHRQWIERRLRALGEIAPSAAEFWLSAWVRLEIRIAPRDKVLARMEACEQQEISEFFEPTTGDPATDEILRSIRDEELEHSRQLHELRMHHSS